MLSLLLIISIECGSSIVFAAPIGTITQEQTEHLPTGDVETYWNQLSKEYGGYFPDNRTPSFKELMTPGGEGFSFKMISQAFLNYFFHELLYNGKLLASIVILTVFSTILQTLQSTFERTLVSKIAYGICYMVVIIIAINSFSVAIGYAKSAIESMIHFMIAMVPLLLTLLASMGNITTVSILHPLIVFMIQWMVLFPQLQQWLTGLVQLRWTEPALDDL